MPTTERSVTRTEDEIIARIGAIRAEGQFADLFGKRQEVLICALPFERAKAEGFLREDATEDQWADEGPGNVHRAASDYVDFAVSKVAGERGLSAERSTQAYGEYVWLLTDDQTHERYDATEYGWYGRTQLAFAFDVLGLEVERDAALLEHGVAL